MQYLLLRGTLNELAEKIDLHLNRYGWTLHGNLVKTGETIRVLKSNALYPTMPYEREIPEFAQQLIKEK